MAFSETEPQLLLQLKFVGSEIIDRLEQMDATLDEILSNGFVMFVRV
ncbi:hypothetical protein [Snodgrassella alvi]|nr:hypothetical protein [Snodgrassella alvi]